jgi:hypothetical protein
VRTSLCLTLQAKLHRRHWRNDRLESGLREHASAGKDVEERLDAVHLFERERADELHELFLGCVLGRGDCTGGIAREFEHDYVLSEGG